MIQNPLQMEQEAFYPVHERIKQQIQSYLIINDIIADITDLVLEGIEKKELLKSIPPYATIDTNKITDTLIKKDLLQCNYFQKQQFETNDTEPKINIKEVWMRYGTKTTHQSKSKITTLQTSKTILAASNSTPKFQSNPFSFSKNQFNDYTISLNLQNNRKDCEEQDYLRKKKKEEDRKAKIRDIKKNVFRKGVKLTEDDTDINSIKHKQKKNYKFIYDDEGKKIFISQIDKYNSPEEIQMAFEFERIKTSTNAEKKKYQKIAAQQNIIKAKDRLILGQSTYEMNRIDNSPFGKNFSQKPCYETFRSKQQKNKKTKRNSFNLFQETQTFLNKQFALDKKQNRNSIIPDNFKQINFDKSQSQSVFSTHISEGFKAKKSQIRVFNKQLLKRIININETRPNSPKKSGSQLSIKLRPSFSKH